MTISNVKPEGLDVKLVPTHPLAYAPREGWSSLCGSAGITAGSNSVPTTSLINIINFILPDTFEGCSEGKGQVRLMHGGNVLASVDITVSNTPAHRDADAGSDSHANTYSHPYPGAYADSDSYAKARSHSDAGSRAYADAYRHADARSHRDAGSRAYADAYSHANANSNRYADARSHGDAGARRYADSQPYAVWQDQG